VNGEPPRDEVWTCLDGRKLKVSEMDEQHVRNALNMVIRRARRRTARLMLHRELQALAARIDDDIHNDKIWGDS